MLTKTCSTCGEQKPADTFDHGRCRDCVNAYHREWRAKNKDAHRAAVNRYRTSAKGRAATRNGHLRRNYSISLEEVLALVEKQNGLCAICHQPLGDDEAVDHCHETGVVRGVLHRKCNAALGGLGDDYLLVQRAALYLNQHRRDVGIHPWAQIGGPPEAREWMHDPERAHQGVQMGVDVVAHAFVTVDGGIRSPTTIGDRCLLLAKCHVGHDAQVGEDCELTTGCVIGGYAEVGAGAKIGLNAVILPYRRVGCGATVGAGSVVTKDIPAGETWAGNPAQPMDRNPVPYTEREHFEAVGVACGS